MGARPAAVWAEETAPTVQTELNAGDEDDPRPKRQFTKWNNFEGPFTSFHYGGGFLVAYAAYAQDEDSKEQISMSPDLKMRDARILLDGKFTTKRPFTWCAGLMYDGPS